MKLTFLGTGTSFGVPVVGCECDVCTSDDSRNRRTRHGLLLEGDGGTLLVDTPPELRLQLVAARYEAELRRRFDYFLGPDASSQPGTSIPGIELVLFDDRDEIEAAGFALRTIAFPHGQFDSYGFRTGDLAVVVDAKRIPDDAWDLLAGARTLVINALWFGRRHPTHFTVEEAVDVAERLGAEQTWLTHLTHEVEYSDALRRLPAGIRPAYDGLTVEV